MLRWDRVVADAVGDRRAADDRVAGPGRRQHGRAQEALVAGTFPRVPGRLRTSAPVRGRSHASPDAHGRPRPQHKP
jgi:hypothetical protein